MSNFPILSLAPSVTTPAFVRFWARGYTDDDASYEQSIKLNPGQLLNQQDLVDLMNWKERRFTESAGRFATALDPTVLNRAREVEQFSDDELVRFFEDIATSLQEAGLTATG
jgi:hypothetical protein